MARCGRILGAHIGGAHVEFRLTPKSARAVHIQDCWRVPVVLGPYLCHTGGMTTTPSPTPATPMPGSFVECGQCGAHLYPTGPDSTGYRCGNGHDLGASDIALEYNETADLRDDGTGAALYLTVHDDLPSAGARVQIPTVSGPRNVPTFATVIGPDPDNTGHVLVRTDIPVMGEHVHSIEASDVVTLPTADDVATTTTVAIADESDIVATIDVETLRQLLTIAAVQLDCTTEDEAADYGLSLADAGAMRGEAIRVWEALQRI